MPSSKITNLTDTSGYALAYADERKLAAHDADRQEIGTVSLFPLKSLDD